MFDLSRIRPFLYLGGCLFLLLMAANLGLTLLSALVPGWLPRQFFGVDFVKDNRQRAIAAAAQYEQGVIDDGKPLVVILGLSSASAGIQLETLAQGEGKKYRYRLVQPPATHDRGGLEDAVPSLRLVAFSQVDVPNQHGGNSACNYLISGRYRLWAGVQRARYVGAMRCPLGTM